MARNESTLIVGVGSPHGDDRIGWVICDELSQCGVRADSNVIIRQLKSPIEILHWLPERSLTETPQRLVVCDACSGLNRAGQVAHWNWPSDDFASLRWSGTHDFSIPQVLSLASALGRLPSDVALWAIEKSETHRVSLDDRLPEVIQVAIRTVVLEIQRGLSKHGGIEATEAGS